MIYKAQLYGNRPPQRISFNEPVDLLGSYATPAAGKVIVVRGDGTSVLNYDDQYSAMVPGGTPVVASMAEAFALTVANRGDTILVLPGTTGNIAGADAWAFKAGVRVVGIGWGTLIPTFTFTVAAAQILMNDANCSISGCRFLCAGPAGTTALTVTAALVMSAAGCSFTDNQCEVGIDADQICATFLTVSGANCVFSRNRVETQVVGAAITDTVIIAAGAHFLVMEDNFIKATLGAVGTGIVRTSGAAKDVLIRRNFLHAWLANSTIAINFGASASTGRIEENLLRIEKADDVTSALTLNAANDITANGNLVCNEKNTTAIAIGTAST
jgi:hypothetical protein